MQRLRSRHRLTPTLALLTALLLAGRADAHKLGADCRLHDGRVELEAYYDDNTPARDARVGIEDTAHRLVTEGRTDAKGCWSFAALPPGHYLVIVDAGAGHRAQMDITLPAEPTAPTATVAPGACDCCDGTEPASLSDGPGRAAFTACPWLRLAIGVAILGSVGGGFWIARRVGAAKSP